MDEINYLYHYYNKDEPPFRTLTSLAYNEAKVVICSELPENAKFDVDNFLEKRYERDKLLREKFISIGGKPIRTSPVYFTLGPNEGMKTWFNKPDWIKIPFIDFDPLTVSFTYGDSFAVFNPSLNTGEEWWGNIYFYDKMQQLIEKYGFPEDPLYDMQKRIFPKDKHINNYLKFIEAHIWSDETLSKYCKKNNDNIKEN